MRKHYCFSLLLALLLLITTGISAQSSVFRVGFESGIPASWSQDPTTVTTMWTSGSNGISVGTAELDAYEGSNYASLFATSSQSEVKLITDMVDASTLTAPILSYAIVQPSNSSGFVDSLRVYYRNSATDAWTLLVCDKTPTATWLRREVALTGVSLSSIQFAFEYNYANGRGVGLDDSYLGNMQTCVTHVFGYTYQITDTSATLNLAS